ncbi:MAG: hypothetical protein COB99_07130, partial [Sulfurimonas sp.]
KTFYKILLIAALILISTGCSSMTAPEANNNHNSQIHQGNNFFIIVASKKTAKELAQPHQSSFLEDRVSTEITKLEIIDGKAKFSVKTSILYQPLTTSKNSVSFCSGEYMLEDKIREYMEDEISKRLLNIASFARNNANLKFNLSFDILGTADNNNVDTGIFKTRYLGELSNGQDIVLPCPIGYGECIIPINSKLSNTRIAILRSVNGYNMVKRIHSKIQVEANDSFSMKKSKLNYALYPESGPAYRRLDIIINFEIQSEG